MSGVESQDVEFRREPVEVLGLWREARDLLWPEPYWLFMGICVVGIMIASAAPMGILAGPMMCGMYLCFFERFRNRPVRFELLFKGFEYFIESLVAMLIIVAVSLATVLLSLITFVGMAVMIEAGELDGSMILVMVLAWFAIYAITLLIAFVIGACFGFAFPLVVDRGLTGIEAVKLSLRASWANLGSVLRLHLFNMFVMMLAAMLCYVPVLFLAPLSLCTQALLYRRIFPDLLPQPTELVFEPGDG